MKKIVLLLACLMGVCSLVSCHGGDGKDDSSSSQAATGKKSHFVIEEVTD